MRALPAIVALVALRMVAAGQDSTPKPAFEVASIRPFVPRPGSAGIAPPQNPEHLAISTALRTLILRAYGLETYQLVGPDSLATVWTVAANAPPGTTQQQANLMLQSLLEERFHLTFHREMKELKAYNLVIAKGGMKLKESIPTDGCSMGATSVAGKQCGPASEQFGIAKAAGQGPAIMMTSPKGLSTARGFPMADFARAIRLEAGEIVIDKTGLSGSYDIRIQYSTTNLRNGRPFDEDSPLPTIFDALQQQLGLKLEPVKAMIEMMVIDHVDATPADN